MHQLRYESYTTTDIVASWLNHANECDYVYVGLGEAFHHMRNERLKALMTGLFNITRTEVDVPQADQVIDSPKYCSLLSGKQIDFDSALIKRNLNIFNDLIRILRKLYEPTTELKDD